MATDPVSTPRGARNSTAFADAWRDLGEVLGLSFPIIVAMASHTLMGSVDTWMLSHYGRAELAAAGASGAVAFVYIAFVFGTANCTSTFVSQSMGRGAYDECARYTWQGMYFGVIVQAVAIPLIIAAPSIFTLFHHAPRVQGLESIYFRIRMAHVMGTASYAALSSFFQSTRRPGIPMVVALVANVVNALLDYVFIFGHFGAPALGIAGAALATAFASYLQAGLLLVCFLWRPMHQRFASRTRWRPDLARFRQLMWVGAPSGLSFMLDVASWAVFINLLIGRLGDSVLAANTIANTLFALCFMPAVGMNKGVTVLVGQYIGRRNIPAAKRRAYLGIGVAMAYMTSMGLLLVIFRRPIIRFFRPDDPAVVAIGATMMIPGAVYQAFDALGIVSMGALRGAGDTRFPAVIGVAAAWGILLPLGYLLTFTAGFGYVGAWSAAAIHLAIIGSIFFWRFASEAWRKIDIFGAASSPSPPGT